MYKLYRQLKSDEDQLEEDRRVYWTSMFMSIFTGLVFWLPLLYFLVAWMFPDESGVTLWFVGLLLWIWKSDGLACDKTYTWGNAPRMNAGFDADADADSDGDLDLDSRSNRKPGNGKDEARESCCSRHGDDFGVGI